MLSATSDHGSALAESERLAGLTGRAPSSADLLIGLLRAGGSAARLLEERGITAARLEAALANARPEPRFDVAQLARSSHEIAARVGARQTSSLHLLLALLRTGSGAVEVLRLSGHDPGKIRALALRALTGPGPIAERATPRGGPMPPAPAPPSDAPSPREVATPSPSHAAEDAWDLSPLDAPRSPVLHRERELGRLLDLLGARPSRVIAVVAESGSGRSALLAALASASADKPLAPVGAHPALPSPGAFIVALHRLAPPQVPLVLDGAGLVGPEQGDGPAQILATAAAGRRWILVVTPADIRRFELGAADLMAAVELVRLAPLLPEDLLDLLEGALDAVAESAGVSFSPAVCRALLRLSPRYPSDRAQPGRSLAIAEVAAARAVRLGQRQVGEEEVAQVVADAAGLPRERLLRTDDERFRTLEQRLAERVVGHEAARGRIADVLRRSHAGFRGRRPLASLLLLGPTGVGKTETARAIAEALFDGETALLRIDLSEYSEPHSVARLIGSPPGYIGHEDGGQLTEGIRRRPAQVVLLDELEKAHREVLLVLLQVLEDGRLTDGRGRTVDFSAAAVVMTSNLGNECDRRGRAPAPSAMLGLARGRLPQELWNRIDEVLCYAPLEESELASIVGRIAAESSRRLEAERGISFRIDEKVVAQVLRAEPDRSLGARPLRRAFERLVESPIAAEILAGGVRRGAHVNVRAGRDGRILLGP